MQPKVSVILLTFNEEIYIQECLEQLRWADEIIVVDSGSTDRTCAIAGSMDATVFHHPFDNFSEQRNYAFSKASGDWLFIVDADERLSDALINEICEKIRLNDQNFVYAVTRINYFWGKRLRFGGTQNDVTPRLVARNAAHYAHPVHEILVTDRKREILKNPLLHLGTRNLDHYRQKVVCYVPLEIRLMKNRKLQRSFGDVLIRPPARFFYLYIIRLGILDGWGGLQFAIMSAWYEFEKQRLYWQMTYKKT